MSRFAQKSHVSKLQPQVKCPNIFARIIADPQTSTPSVGTEVGINFLKLFFDRYSEGGIVSIGFGFLVGIEVFMSAQKLSLLTICKHLASS